MGPRLGSPPSSFPNPFPSHSFSIRKLSYIALALITFIFFYRSFQSKPDISEFYEGSRTSGSHFPLESGLSYGFQSHYGEPDSLAGVIDDSELRELARLKADQENQILEKEKQETKEAERKKKQEEEARKQKEEQDRRQKEEEARKQEDERRKQEAESLAKQKEIHDEEERRKEEERKEASNRKSDDQATGRIQRPDQEQPSVQLDKESSGPTDQGPKNQQDLTTTLVTGRLLGKPEEIKWIDEQLKDITHKRIYFVDDPTAELHLEKNKGRESIIYIKYILDFYDNLDDITLFFHSSRKAWHNNALMAQDAAVMINNLQRSWIMEKGYVNARCEHHPGCPQWIKWNATKAENDIHPERASDLFQADLWSRLFPNRTRTPVVLSQPCCSQFAASRDTIRSVSKEQYEVLYEWLRTTDTLDVYTGRIMEYLWQFLFLDKDEHCPDMSECYCKGYGLCLEDDTRLKEYNQIKAEIDEVLQKMDQWDGARGCHAKGMTPEVRKACKDENPWGKPLGLLRDQRMTLENDLLKHYGIKEP